jgi:hypothetical protein
MTKPSVYPIPDSALEGEADALPPLRSVHTESFPFLLAEFEPLLR